MHTEDEDSNDCFCFLVKKIKKKHTALVSHFTVCLLLLPIVLEMRIALFEIDVNDTAKRELERTHSWVFVQKMWREQTKSEPAAQETKMSDA